MITYPLPLPSLSFAHMSIRRVSAIASSSSPFSLLSQVYAWQGKRFVISAACPPANEIETADWHSFFDSLNGMEGTFHIGPVGVTAVARGVVTGTPLVNGGSQTGDHLITDGWTINMSNIVRGGDYFEVGTGLSKRLYVIKQNADSDSGGNATLEIWPDLIESPSNNVGLIFTNPEGTFRMIESEYGEWDVDGYCHGISFMAVEAK